MGDSKRRSPGEGSKPRLRPDGRWEARYVIVATDGKHLRRSVYGGTMRDCQRALAKAKRDREDDQNKLPATAVCQQTVGEFLDEWIGLLEAEEIAANTLIGYRKAIKNHLRPALGTIRLIDLDPGTIQKALAQRKNHRTGKPLSLSYRNILRGNLRVALNLAIRWGKIERNPIALTEPVRVPKRRPAFYTPEQSTRLLESVRGTQDEPMIAMALLLGLRIGEVQALHWEDVDFDQARMTIRGTKTAGSNVVLPLLPELARIYRAHLARQRLECRIRGFDWRPDLPLFLGRFGESGLKELAFRERFRKAANRAGLPAIRFHDMRHTCASLLIHLGIPVHVISAILRHSRTSTTLDIYTHLLPKADEAALGALESLLFEGNKDAKGSMKGSNGQTG